MMTKVIKSVLFILFISIVLTGCKEDIVPEPNDEEPVAEFTLLKAHVGGYMIAHRQNVDESYNAGFSMYAAAWQPDNP